MKMKMNTEIRRIGFKHVGEVIDPSYWDAWKENNPLNCIEAVKQDCFKQSLDKYGWRES
jgi:hypothetical protein